MWKIHNQSTDVHAPLRLVNNRQIEALSKVFSQKNCECLLQISDESIDSLTPYASSFRYVNNQVLEVNTC